MDEERVHAYKERRTAESKTHDLAMVSARADREDEVVSTDAKAPKFMQRLVAKQKARVKD